MIIYSSIHPSVVVEQHKAAHHNTWSKQLKYYYLKILKGHLLGDFIDFQGSM